MALVTERTTHAGIYDLDDLAALDGQKDKLASNFGLDVSPLKWNAQAPSSPSSRTDLAVFCCSV